MLASSLKDLTATKLLPHTDLNDMSSYSVKRADTVVAEDKRRHRHRGLQFSPDPTQAFTDWSLPGLVPERSLELLSSDLDDLKNDFDERPTAIFRDRLDDLHAASQQRHSSGPDVPCVAMLLPLLLDVAK